LPTSFHIHCPILALALLSILTGFAAAQSTPSKPNPNIILFLVDDLGWSDVECYGSTFYETPHINALAREGVRFTQAYAACHVCSPTRASVLTGKYPARLHLTDWLPGRKDHPFQLLLSPAHIQELPPAEITLAEALKEHGYRTAILGKWHLGEEPHGPTSQGFDLQIPRWNKAAPKRGFYAPFEMEGLEDKPGDYLTDRLTDEAERFIDANREQPFFLYLAHFAVHDPIQGRADFVSYYEKKREELLPNDTPYILEGNPDDQVPKNRQQLQSMIQKPAWSGHKLLPERTIKIKQRQDNAHFAAMVASMDESLGRIMAKLKKLKLDQNTILVFLSDNGGMSAANFGNPERVIGKNKLDAAYSTSNLPLRGAKGWLYEGGIRVPFIVRVPGESARGTTCHEPVITNDLFPTLLDVAGLPLRPDQHCDGLSLAPLLRDPLSTLNRPALFWHFPHYSNHGMQSPGAAIRAGDYKLIEYFENSSVQLFNLKEDPGEQNDLSFSAAPKRMELQTMLHHWQDEINAQRMTKRP